MHNQPKVNVSRTYKSDAQKAINEGLTKIAEKACKEHGGVAQVSTHYNMYDNRKYKAILIEDSS